MITSTDLCGSNVYMSDSDRDEEEMTASVLPPVTPLDMAMGWVIHAGKREAYDRVLKRVTEQAVGSEFTDERIRSEAMIRFLTRLADEYDRSAGLLYGMVTNIGNTMLSEEPA